MPKHLEVVLTPKTSTSTCNNNNCSMLFLALCKCVLPSNTDYHHCILLYHKQLLLRMIISRRYDVQLYSDVIPRGSYRL